MLSDDAVLVARTLNGSGAAFAKLVDRYKGRVFARIFSRVNDVEVARDLSQDAFLRAYVNLRDLRDPSRVAAWLGRIASHTALRWLERRRPDVSLDRLLDEEKDVETMMATYDTPEIQYARREREEALHTALQTLPEEHREVLVMHYMEGLSRKQIATFLDVPVSTVQGRLKRGRDALRDRLIDLGLLEDALRENRPDRKFTERVMAALPAVGYGAVKIVTSWMTILLHYILPVGLGLSVLGFGLWISGIGREGGLYGRGGFKVRLLSRGGASSGGENVQRFAPPTKAPGTFSPEVVEPPLEEALESSATARMSVDSSRVLYAQIPPEPAGEPGEATASHPESLYVLGVQVQLKPPDERLYRYRSDQGTVRDRWTVQELTREEKDALLADIGEDLASRLRRAGRFRSVERMEVLRRIGYERSVEYRLDVSVERSKKYVSGPPSSGIRMDLSLCAVRDGGRIWRWSRGPLTIDSLDDGVLSRVLDQVCVEVTRAVRGHRVVLDSLARSDSEASDLGRWTLRLTYVSSGKRSRAAYENQLLSPRLREEILKGFADTKLFRSVVESDSAQADYELRITPSIGRRRVQMAGMRAVIPYKLHLELLDLASHKVIRTADVELTCEIQGTEIIGVDRIDDRSLRDGVGRILAFVCSALFQP